MKEFRSLRGLLRLSGARFVSAALLIVACASGSAEELRQTQQLEFFEKAVRPLLAKHCYECHSAGAERVEGGLLLDSRAAHLSGGDSGAAIVPGDVDGSLLMEAIRYESYEMPPKGKLPTNDIKTLARWIEMGAPWPDEDPPTTAAKQDTFDLQKRKSEFWVWQPIVAADPPEVTDASWPQNDIDRFILSRLEQAKIRPALDAARTTLLRRIYFDLIGLPPTPAEVSAFLSDDDPGAVGRVVDQLLDSTHFGERWARHWLDLVRYAESRGHEFDNDTPNAFQYRDYVIRALNADVPYDQFVREHIAGDLLPDPRTHPTQGFNESVLGTGFWFLGEWVHSPVDIRKDESDRFDNMLDVMSKTFLGVTVACARCHDHKFDAISTADYYSLSGFLQSSDYRQVRFESMEQNRRVAEELARVDAKYQQQIVALLESHGIELPPGGETSGIESIDPESVIVIYAGGAEEPFLQDGYVFGAAPRPRGAPYLVNGAEPSISVSSHGAAVNDPIWSGLESVTEGGVQNRGALSKIPKSGRTLRTPTFELKHGDVHCFIEGAGHIIACVDSHRLIAGPLHGQTIKKVDAGKQRIKMDLSRYVGHRLHLEFVPAKNDSLSVRMVTQGLNSKQIAQLDRQLAAADERYTKYAEAAEAFLNGSRKTEERVFADFESGTYEGWTVEGEAFGKIPQTLETIADYQGRINGRGTYFVNSHDIRAGEDSRRGDSLTGSMTSTEFTIDFDTIEFLVGGGSHRETTCVNLIVDDKVVLTATGRNNNQMSLNTWDVRPFAGKAAKIRIVDNHTSGWGNIGLDHIVFRKDVIASPAVPEARQIALQWQRERETLRDRIVFKSRTAMAMLDGSGEDDRILIRGNSSKPGEVEPRHFLTAISGDTPMPIETGSGRLQLAEQINDPDNPLTARVIVNRIWHHLMGRGIVATVDDFGVLGQRPTHPELLDHLATRFLNDGRSIKRMIKYIVSSRTYQMSSQIDEEALAADPKNLLWHHRPPRRLEGEAIRDALLALSGRLDRTPFGPPVPIHLTSFMDGRGRPGKSGPLDGNGRRSIYVAVRRNFLSPFMLAFDMPVPFSAMGRRNVSNVPAQALILLNDPLVSELARDWGQRAIDQAPDTDPESLTNRIHWMYQSGFGRRPSRNEIEAATAFVTTQAETSGVTVNAPQLWAKLAHVLVNTKEFIFLR